MAEIEFDTLFTKKGSPADFVNFIPWACTNFNVNCEVIIDKNIIDKQDIGNGSAKKTDKTTPDSSITIETNKADFNVSDSTISGNIVRVKAVYYAGSLVQVKLLNNRYIPRDLFQVMGLTIQFQVLLTSITINDGMDEYTIHELIKILHKSNINDLNFDDAFCPEGNFDLLLERPSKLKSLSLARCKIEDPIVVKLAARLVYTAPGSKSLSILNLSSNRITNVGALALRDALRSNRSLLYLNLANNYIDDDGALAIIEVLQPFLLTWDEVMDVKVRKLNYLRKFNSIVQKRVKWLKTEDFNNADSVIKKKPKIFTRKAKSLNDVSTKTKTILNDTVEETNYAEAEKFALSEIGTFDDPFYVDAKRVGDLDYCNGNYALTYLNLAYNHLSYLVLGPIVDLLDKQIVHANKTSDRGLVSLVLEGNPLPVQCNQLKLIEYYIQIKLNAAVRKFSIKKSTGQGRKSATTK